MVLLRRSVLVPFVITMTENCPEALTHMSCNILVVNALADDIVDTIRILTKRVRNLLNKDLCLTTSSTREILKSEFLRYFTWLRLHQDGLIKICRNNEIFCCVNKSVKAWLKCEEYESPAQILDRYNQKYRKYLTNMNIPLQAFRIDDVKQAVKDIKRDTIMLNNIRYSSHDGELSQIKVTDGISSVYDSQNENKIVDDRDYHDFHKNKTDYINGENINIYSNNDCNNSTASQPCKTKNDCDNFNQNATEDDDEEDPRKVYLINAIVVELYQSLYAQCQQIMKFSVVSSGDNLYSIKYSNNRMNRREIKKNDEKNTIENDNENERFTDVNLGNSDNKSHDMSNNTTVLEFENKKYDHDNEIENEKCDESSGDNPSVSTFSFIEVGHISVDSFEEISSRYEHSLSPSSQSRSRVPSQYNCSCNMGRSVSTVISTSSDCLNASTTDSHTSYSCCTEIFSERVDGPVSRCADGNIDKVAMRVNSPNSIQRVIKLHENVLEMLLNQVLLAASRTTAGGDAYVILENLYGGEGLLLSPRSYKTRHEKSKTILEHDGRDGMNNQGEKKNENRERKNLFAANNQDEIEGINCPNFYDSDMDTNIDQMKSEKALEEKERKIKNLNSVENCSGIDISISKSGIRVVLKEQYNLLLKESLEQNMELCLPLISFECTTTTNISFLSNDINENCFIYDLYSKLVYNAENICRRTITIEPIIFK